MTCRVLGLEARVSSSQCAPPLQFAGLLKAQARFRQRRISLRLSLRDRRGSLLGRPSVNNPG